MGHPSPRPGLDAEVSYKPRAPGSNRTRGCGIPLLPAGLTRGDGELPHSAALPHRSGLAFTPERGSRAIGDYARPDVTVATFQIIKIYWEANPIYPLYTSRSVEQKPHEPLQAATPEDDAADTALGCAMIIIAMILTGLAVWAGVSYFGDDSDQASQSTAPTSSRSLAPPSKASESPSVAAVQSAPVTSGQVDSLYAATPGEDDVAGMRNTEVFRRSEGFDFLMNPGIVVPGGMYTNATAGNSCSFGWVVTDGTRIFNLTAGHCGKVGDRIIVKDKQGRSHDSGQFVESTGTPKNFGSDPDFALIDITGHEYQFSPPLKNLRFPGVVDLQYLSRDNYPHQVAAQLGLPLADASCSGAVIGHYWNDRPKAGQIVPAQRNAIGPDTGLVTIQMGANPGFVGTVAPACARAALGSSGNCAPMGGTVDKAALSSQLTDVVRDARFRAAPGATIALVGYLDEIGNANDSCVYTGFMSLEDRRGIQRFLNSVNSVMADVAAREGVTYVAPPATQGWCGQPGSRDVSPLGPLSADDAFPFHPTGKGHANLAAKIVAAVR